MLCVSCLASRTLALQVIHELVADAERAVVMIELMLEVIDDSIRRCEAMGRKGIALRSIGARDEGRSRNFARILAQIRVRTIADTGTHQITQVWNVLLVLIPRFCVSVPSLVDFMVVGKMLSGRIVIRVFTRINRIGANINTVPAILPGVSSTRVSGELGIGDPGSRFAAGRNPGLH